MPEDDDIEERLIDFAVRVIKLCESLPQTPTGKYLSGQLVRSGTAPAAHYAEALGAESMRDFIHKLRTCLKELNESRVWLKIIIRSEMQPEASMSDLLSENDELCHIINTSIQTTKARAG